LTSTRESVKFGIEGPNYPWEVICDTALFAEKIGFDSFWMPDHLVATGVRRWDALEAWSTLCAGVIPRLWLREPQLAMFCRTVGQSSESG